MNARKVTHGMLHKLPRCPVSEKGVLKRTIKQAINTFIALFMTLVIVTILSLHYTKLRDDIGLIFISLFAIFLIGYFIKLIFKIRHIVDHMNRQHVPY